jgi:tetratricopeptide (TPR) repeat protein
MPVTERSVLYNLLLLVIPLGMTLAQVHPDTKVDSLLTAGIEALNKQDYISAENTFKELGNSRKDLPLGNIFMAGTSMSKSYDLGLQFEKKRIDSLLLCALDLSETLIDIEPGNVWNNFMAGLSHGFKAYYDAINNDFINALFNGYSSLQNFNECLILDENFNDAKISIGTYLYWKTEKTEDLNWLPFFSSDKDKGIDLLKSASSSAKYLKHFALYSLMWIYMNEKKYDEAVNSARQFLELYPESRLFKIGLAKAYKHTDKLKAIEVLQSVLQSYRQIVNNNHLQEILILKMIAELYLELNRYDDVIAVCNIALQIQDITEYVKNQSTERLEQIKKFKEIALSGRESD